MITPFFPDQVRLECGLCSHVETISRVIVLSKIAGKFTRLKCARNCGYSFPVDRIVDQLKGVV